MREKILCLIEYAYLSGRGVLDGTPRPQLCSTLRPSFARDFAPRSVRALPATSLHAPPELCPVLSFAPYPVRYAVRCLADKFFLKLLTK